MSTSRFSLPVMDTISMAWNKVSGAKASFWACIGVMFFIQIGLQIAQAIVFAIPFVNIVLGIPAAIACMFIIVLLMYGILNLSLRRAKDMPISYKDMFQTFDWSLALNLIGLAIIKILIIAAIEAVAFLGTLLFAFGVPGGILGALIVIAAVIAAMYISVRLSMSAFFALDDKAAPIEALRKSYDATADNFWNILGVLIIVWIVNVIALIPLGIGLIWSLPLAWITLAMIYVRLCNQR